MNFNFCQSVVGMGGVKDKRFIFLVTSSGFIRDAMADGFMSYVISASAQIIIVLVLVLVFVFIKLFFVKIKEFYQGRAIIKARFDEYVTGIPQDIDDKSWSQAYGELEKEVLDKALWAKMYYKHKGDENRAKTEYVMRRAKELSQNNNPKFVSPHDKDVENFGTVQELTKSVDPETQISEQIQVLLQELRELGCAVTICCISSGAVVYTLVTPNGIQYSGEVNERELEGILREII